MKKSLSLFIMLFVFVPTFAQNDTTAVETLFSGKIESGGYGAVFVKVGPINDGTGVFVGGQGGWIINHKLVIGGKGYGLANDVNVDGLKNIRLDVGCGGGYIEYIHSSKKLINSSIHTMIGAGAVSYGVKSNEDSHDPIDYSDDVFFIFEPGANINVNVTEEFRIGVGATYRFVSGVKYHSISSTDLTGVSAEMIFKFGLF